MRYIDTWLSGLGLDYIVPKLKANGITTPKKLATLTLREIYEVVGVEDSEDRKKLYFLIQRLQTILQYKPANDSGEDKNQFLEDYISESNPNSEPVVISEQPPEPDLRIIRRNRRQSLEMNELKNIESFENNDFKMKPLQRNPQVSHPIVNNHEYRDENPKGGSKVDSLQYHFDDPVRESDQIYHEVQDMTIRVVVRKRPLSKNELSKGDKDILEIHNQGVVFVNEPKTKVDLTKVIETHNFKFDDAFDDSETNEAIYQRTIRPLVDFVFGGGKATCFAYGQTGSGKTFSMMGCNNNKKNSGLYMLAASDIFTINRQKKLNLKVLVSCFEIYGGKLYDLLNSRNIIKCLEDAKQNIQILGLTEHEVTNVEELIELMTLCQSQRSIGSTAANAESSRSHQIFQIVLKDQSIKSTKKENNRKSVLQIIERKLSFIDLAGSERGADTTHSSKQTRMEGAEINTSLLALKEVIRSLEKKQSHTPFRGSKLTQVLKDSFIGDKTRTCMLVCVSPAHSNCEHTLNTLRYADRVKEHQAVSNNFNEEEKVDKKNDLFIPNDEKLINRRISNVYEVPVISKHISNHISSDSNTKPLPSYNFSETNSKHSQNQSSSDIISKKLPLSGSPETTYNTNIRNKYSDKTEVEESNSANLYNTGLLKMTLNLLSAHKLSIAEMVEVMKDEMELVQQMENVDDRNTEEYLDHLESILKAKSDAINTLRSELNSFLSFRVRETK